MSDTPTDPRWPKLLSLSVHEFRTPMTVVAGYIRMLLKDRAGPLTDPQRRLLEEAERSCTRLSALLAELSDLANLEAGNSTYNRQAVDLRTIIREAVEQLAPLPDRQVEVRTAMSGDAAPVEADPTRLRTALGSVFAALRREVVTSDVLNVEMRSTGAGAFEIVIGDDETIAAMREANRDHLPVFDEWRGGSGLSLAIARRILNAHSGTIAGAPDGYKAGARLLLPSS